MRIRFVKIFSVIFILILLFSLVSCENVFGDLYSYSTSELRLNLYECQSIFGCTPEEFFDLELDIYEEAGDFRDKAKITSNGYLVLNLTPKQERALADSSLLTDYGDNPRIEVSYEDKYVIVNGFEETVENDVSELSVIADKLRFRLVLNDEFGYDYPPLRIIIQDGETKEVYYTSNYPGFNIEFGKYNFSPLPK